MTGKTKPISRTELKKIELIEDGRQGQRFETMLRKVVSVPREEILRREAAEKKVKEKKS